MIGREVTNNPARRHRECYYVNKGIRLNDPRVDLDDLPLGRIATSDWSNCRVLDRMMMYERRIENSVIKLMKELKRFQTIRRIEVEDAEQEHEPSPSLRDEAATHSAVKKVNLKKQSQYIQAIMAVKSFVKGEYDNNPASGLEENKANLTLLNSSKELEKEKIARSNCFIDRMIQIMPAGSSFSG